MKKHRAWWQQGWEERRLVNVIIARARGSGMLDVGVFLVDTGCLGVKDAFAVEIPASEIDGFVTRAMGGEEPEAIEPAGARKLIEDAIGYAKALGFLPHRDFRKARKVLGGIESKGCDREFTFGRDGQPFYVAGPHDDEARINRVLSVLTARLGEGGFKYIVPADPFGPDEDEKADAVEAAIEEFRFFVEGGSCPNETLTTSECDGFLVGLYLLPEAVMPSEWLPELWGGKDLQPVYADAETAKAVFNGLMLLYNQIGGELETDDFVPTFPGPEDEPRLPWASVFAKGVLRALALRPAALNSLRQHADAGASISLLERLAGPDAAETPEAMRDLATGHGLGPELGEAAAALYSLTRKSRPPPR